MIGVSTDDQGFNIRTWCQQITKLPFFSFGYIVFPHYILAIGVALFFQTILTRQINTELARMGPYDLEQGNEACLLPRQRDEIRNETTISCAVRARQCTGNTKKLSMAGPPGADFAKAKSMAMAFIEENHTNHIRCCADDADEDNPRAAKAAAPKKVSSSKQAAQIADLEAQQAALLAMISAMHHQNTQQAMWQSAAASSNYWAGNADQWIYIYIYLYMLFLHHNILIFA